ncbi:MAG: hypothetical protein IJ706_01080 [Clostridia bacterium]|nr:hypothetical protein [Clostridia bacterium]
MIGCADNKTKNAEHSDTLLDVGSDQSISIIDPSDSTAIDNTTSISEKNNNEEYIVNFINNDVVIKREEVPGIDSIRFPKITLGDAFFKEWSGLPVELNNNCDLVSVVDEVKNVRNAIGYDAVYAHIGNNIDINIRITGQVDICGVSMEIHFSTDFEFVDVIDADPYSVYHFNPETQVLKCEFVSGYNINSEVDLLSIRLKATSVNNLNKLNIIINDCYKFNQNGDDLIDSEYNLFNEKLIII